MEPGDRALDGVAEGAGGRCRAARLRACGSSGVLADELVISHYQGGASTKNDSSAGPGHLFAKTAVRACSHAIGRGLIGGTRMDASKESALRVLWRPLRKDTV